MNRFVKLCAVCVAGVAQASGFYLGDNGAKAMLQGGAFAAQADDATAMQHNPAGLAQQPGFGFLVDLQVLNHDVGFLRQDPGFDPADPQSPKPSLIATVHNAPSPFLLPFFAASYGFPLAGRTFTVGLGLFAPPSQGRYNYPSPSYELDANGNYVASPRKTAPQRYALISNDIVIAYPTLSLAYDIHPMFQIGVSAQLTVSNFAQSQMMYGGDALNDNPQKQLLENPDYDARVAIDLPGQIGFTGILGLMFRPTDWLSFGASVRPPIPFKSRGKITVDLPQFFTAAGATVVGANGGSCATVDQPKGVTNCEAELVMTMPLELKFGARVLPVENLGINLDFIYQGWNSIQQLLLTPQGVNLKANPGAEPVAIAAFGVPKKWMPTWSVRLGGTYRLHQFVSVSLGAMYETGAAPTATYSVDWTHPSRFIFTGGVTGHLGPIELIVGAIFTPTVTTVVEDSIVARGQTNPDIAAGVVGNGIYTSGAWGMNFGVRGHFGADAPAKKPLIGPKLPAPAPEPAPAPVAAPTPAPAPEPASTP